MRRRQVLFFGIIAAALLIILLSSTLSRFLIRPPTPIPPLTPTAATAGPHADFIAAVTAETGRDAIEISGIPNVSLGTKTWDGLEIEITNVNWDGWPLIKLENQFNDPPNEGRRMLLITLHITNVAGDPDKPITVFDSNFRVMGEYQTPYTTYGEETRCGVVPEELSGNLTPGASVTGNICVQVPTAEDGLLLVYEARGGYPNVFFPLSEIE